MLRFGLGMDNLLRNLAVGTRSFNLRGYVKHSHPLSCRLSKLDALIHRVLEYLALLSYLLSRSFDDLAGMHRPGKPGRDNTHNAKGRVCLLFYRIDRG